MHIIIQSSENTLQKAIYLLERLNDNQLGDHSVAPYYSCIGSHIRHIIDFYDCIIIGLDSKCVNLTKRTRDLKMHGHCDYALNHVNRVISQLEFFADTDLDTLLEVEDDLGMGKTKINYTLGALLAQANSHAIHHYAIISYILDRLGIDSDDESFGYNPTTPRSEFNLS